MDNREDCKFFLRFFSFSFLIKVCLIIHLIKYWDFKNSSLSFENEDFNFKYIYVCVYVRMFVYLIINLFVIEIFRICK